MSWIMNVGWLFFKIRNVTAASFALKHAAVSSFSLCHRLLRRGQSIFLVWQRENVWSSAAVPGFAVCAAIAHVLLTEWVQNCCSTAAAGVKGRCCSWVEDLLCVGRHTWGTTLGVVYFMKFTWFRVSSLSRSL